MRLRFFLASFITIVFVYLPSLTLQSHSGAHRQEAAGSCHQETEKEHRLNQMASSTLGGVKDSGSAANSVEIESLGRFAVEEHNKKENAMIEFVRVVNAKKQVVSGELHHLTLEVIDSGKKELYEAKVWLKQWMNFKELQAFDHVREIPIFTASDLGAKREGPVKGLKSIPEDDPFVLEAAEHAVKTIQQKSNTLDTYELQEIVLPKAEVMDDASAKVQMLIKTKRGSKEEQFDVEVHKKNDGKLSLTSHKRLED
ncbi:unnamed protein product [Cuscuta epithymum]|uniref:Cysteine proteinase inhibitor n=1 Tax=Cuscuta epithymum TaxID=186058 RepID=A0AAV0EA71_9ASTE|nr:unnamed protein product [Cuscuta epithymum]